MRSRIGLARLYRGGLGDGGRASIAARVALLAAAGLVALSFVVAMGFLAVSANNYAGGEAMHLLHAKLADGPGEVHGQPPRVHIGVEAAMSGVTRYVRLLGVFSFVSCADSCCVVVAERCVNMSELTVPLNTPQTELQAGVWEYSKEEVALTDKSTGADFAAAGFTHLITAHPKNGVHDVAV